MCQFKYTHFSKIFYSSPILCILNFYFLKLEHLKRGCGPLKAGVFHVRLWRARACSHNLSAGAAGHPL